MIFGHAPIIFPAVARVKLLYHPAFYLQLGVLHVSLLMRVVGDLADMLPVRQAAAIANSIALLTFVVTMVISAFRGRSSRNLKYA
jgi:hypothetical protein